MKKKISITNLWLLIFLFQPLCGQNDVPKLPAEAQKYYAVLIDRPEASAVFDRFYHAWLSEGSAEELLAFLKAKSGSTQRAKDYHLLARLYERLGLSAEALKVYEEITKVDPQYCVGWISRAKLEFGSKRYSETLSLLDKASQCHPGSAQVLQIGKLKGRSLIRLGKDSEALEVWTGLTNSNPDDNELSLDLMNLLLDEGLFDAAVEKATTLVERTQDPIKKVSNQRELVNTLILANRKEDALNVLESMLVASGNGSWIESEVLSRISRIFREDENIAGLEKHLEYLVELKPQSTELVWQHTKLLGETGNKEKALASGKAILRRNPNDRALREQFIELLASLGWVSDAAKQAKLLAQLTPDKRRINFRLATLQFQSGDSDGARSTLQDIIKSEAATESEWIRAAKLFARWQMKGSNDESLAEKAFETAVEKFPTSFSAKNEQAKYLYKHKKTEAARLVWEKLSRTCSLDELLYIADVLAANFSDEVAFAALFHRQKEYTKDRRFLDKLVSVGIAAGRFKEAVLFALIRLNRSTNFDEIASAIDDFEILIRLDEELVEPLEKELNQKQQLTIQDRCLSAQIRINRDEFEEAVLILDGASGADQPIALASIAQIYEERNDWLSAAQTLERVERQSKGNSISVVQKLVHYNLRALRLDESLKWVEEWKYKAPESPQARLSESVVLEALEQPQEAWDRLRKAVRKFPDNEALAVRYVNLSKRLEKWEEVEREYWNLYKKADTFKVEKAYVYELTRVALKRNSVPRLIERFEQRQRSNRASAKPWLILAEVYKTLHKDEERRRCLYEASKLRPDDIQLLHEIAEKEVEIGKYQEAIETLGAAAKLDITGGTEERIAELYLENGELEKGYNLLFRLENNGKALGPRGIDRLADAIAQSGDFDSMVGFLEPFLERYSNDYRLLYLLGIGWEEQRRDSNALSYFFRILENATEYSNAKVASPILDPQNYSGTDIGLWSGIRAAGTRAYKHRHNFWERSYAYYPRSNPLFSQPTSLSGAKHLAIYHIIEILYWMDEADPKVASSIERLKRNGVGFADFLLQAKIDSGSLSPNFLIKHPKNLLLYKVWFQERAPGTPEESFAIFESLWQNFEEDPLALAGAIRAAIHAEEDSAIWLDRIIQKLLSKPKLEEKDISDLAPLLRKQLQNENRFSLVSQAKWRSLSSALEKSYHSLHLSDYYFITSILAFLVSEDWPLVDNLVERVLQAKQVVRAPKGVQRLYLLPNVPVRVAEVLGGNLIGTSESIQKALQPYIDSAEPKSAHRLILRLIAGQDRGILEELDRAEGLSVDQLLTKAWIAQKNYDFATVSKSLVSALELTTDTKSKIIIEGALIYAVSSQYAGDPSNFQISSQMADKVQDLIRVRLKGAIGFEEQMVLINSLRATGAENEANALISANSIKGGTASPYSRRSTLQARSSMFTLSSVGRLLNEGREDEAVKGFIDLVGNDGWENHSFITFMKERGLEGLLKDRLSKEAGNGWQTRLRYASFLDALKEPSAVDQAIVEYEKVLPMNPRAYQSLYKLTVLKAIKGDVPGALRHWESLPTLKQVRYLPKLIDKLDCQSGGGSGLEALALSEVLSGWLESFDPNRPLPPNVATWLGNAVNHIGMNVRNTSYPSLHFGYRDSDRWSLDESGNLKIEKDKLKKRQLRRKAHDDLCRAMLHYPEVAFDAFSKLSAVAAYENDQLKEVEIAGLELIEKLENPRFRRLLKTPSISGSFVSNEGGIAFPPFGIFFIRQSVLNQDADQLESTIFPAILELHGPQYLAFCRSYYQWLISSEEQFISAAKQLLNSEVSKYSAFRNGGGMFEVINLWRERQYSEPLDNLFFSSDTLVENYFSSEAVDYYISILSQRGNGDALRFTKSLRNHYLGELKVEDYLKLDDNDQSYRQGFKKVCLYLEWLERKLSVKGFEILLPLVFENGLDRDPERLERFASQYLAGLSNATPEAFIASATVLNILSDADRFRAFEVRSSGRWRTWIGGMVKTVRERWKSEAIVELNRQLETLKPSLGRDITLALLHQSISLRSDALTKCLISYQQDLDQLSNEGKRDLSTLLNQELSGYPDDVSKLGDELTTALEPLLVVERIRLTEKFDGLLELRELSRSGIGEKAELIGLYSTLNQERAIRAARHIVKLLDEKSTESTSSKHRDRQDFIAQIASFPALIETAINLAIERGYHDSPKFWNSVKYDIVQALRMPERRSLVFSNTVFVAEAGEFLDFQLREDSHPTVLSAVIQEAAYSYELYSEFRSLLEQAPPTFGRDLLLAVIHREPKDRKGSFRLFYNDDTPDPSKVLQFIKNRKGEFNLIQPASAASLLAMLRARVPTLEEYSAKDAEVLEGLQILRRIDQNYTDSLVNRWLAVSSLEETPFQSPSEASEIGISLLEKVALSDSGRAEQVIDHFMDLMKSLDDAGKSEPHKTQQSRWLKSVVEEFPELFDSCYDRAIALGATNDRQWHESFVKEAVSLYNLRKQDERIFALLDQAGVFVSAKEFKTRQVGPPESKEYWFGHLVSSILKEKSYFPDLKDYLDKKPVCFGRDLFMAATNLNDGSGSWGLFFDKYSSQIAALDEPEQLVIAHLVKTFGAANFAYDRVPELRGALESAVKAERRMNRRIYDDFLLVKSWFEFENLMLRNSDVKKRYEQGSRSEMLTEESELRFRSRKALLPLKIFGDHLAYLARIEPELGNRLLNHFEQLYIEEFIGVSTYGKRPEMGLFLNQMSGTPELYLGAFDLFITVIRIPMIGPSGPAGYTTYWITTTEEMAKHLIPAHVLGDVDRLHNILEQSGLLASSAELKLSSSYNMNPVRAVVDRIKQAPSRVQTGLVRVLQGETTFGSKLMVCLLLEGNSESFEKSLERLHLEFGNLTPSTAAVVLGAFEAGLHPSLQPLKKLRAIEESRFIEEIQKGGMAMKVPYRGEFSVVHDELTRLIETDPESANGFIDQLFKYVERDIVFKRADVMRTRKRKGEKFGRFLKRRGGLLFYAAARMPSVRVLNDQIHEDEVPWGMDIIYKDWRDQGGWIKPGEVFAEVMEDLSLGDPNVTRGLWLPSFFYNTVEISYLERNAMAEVAKRNLEGSTWTSAAREFLIAMQLIECTEPLRPGRYLARVPKGDAASQEKYTQLSIQLNEMLRDETIPSHIRMSLAAFLIAIYPGSVEEELVYFWGEEVVDCLINKQAVSPFELRTILNAASVLPKNESWHRVAERIRNLYKKRSDSKSWTLSNWYDRMILRYVTGGKPEFLTEQDIKYFMNPNSEYRSIPGVVSRDQQSNQFVPLFAQNYRKLMEASYIENANGLSYTWHYSTVPLEKVKTDEDSLLFHAVGLNFDPVANRLLFGDNNAQNKTDRYLQFARKLAKVDLPKNLFSREHTLAELAIRNPAVARENLWPQFIEVMEAINVDEREHQFFLGAYSALEFIEGNPEVVEHYYKKTGGYNSDFVSAFVNCLRSGWRLGNEFDPEPLQALSFFSALEGSFYDGISCVHQVSQLWDDQSDYDGSSDRLETDNIVKLLSDLSLNLQKRTVEERLRFFLRIVGRTNLGHPFDEYWKLLVDYDLLSREEILEHHELILQSNGMSFEQLSGLGSYLRRAGSHDKAIRTWQKALAPDLSNPDQPRVKDINNLKFELASMLIRTNQISEGKQLINELKKDKTQIERVNNLLWLVK